MNENDPYYFTHTVLFWLKESSDEEQKKQLKDGLMKLVANSQYSKLGHVGIPAGTDRPVVDNTYDFSLLVTFETSADQDFYQTEPAHLTFLEECKHLWSKVLVLDSISVAK